MQKPKEITKIWNKNFICILIVNTLLCLAHSSVNPLVASYTIYLETSAQVTGLLAGMFFGVSLLMRPVAGPVTTKVDKRLLLILVFALGCAANLGYASFRSVPMFVAFRFLNGVQYSFVGSLIMTLAGDNLPSDKMASGMGFYGVGGAIATAVAPSIGIYLQKYGEGIRSTGFGFTLAFLFAAAILGIAMVPSFLISRDTKTKEDVKSTGAWYKNIISVHALPLVPTLFFVVIAYSLYNVYIVEYGKSLGIETSMSLFYLVLALSLAVTRPLSGYVTERFGIRKVLLPSLAVFAGSFIVVGLSTTLSMLLLGAILAAIGYGAAQPTIQAMCLQTSEPLKRGVASNTIYVGIDLAYFIGPFFGSLVYAGSGYSVMFMTAVVPVFLAMISFVIIFPVYTRRRKYLLSLESEPKSLEVKDGK